MDYQGAGRAAGDILDLGLLDANSIQTGDQAFVFSRAPGPGRVWLTDDAVTGHTLLSAWAAWSDHVLTVRLVDGAVLASAYTADDFVL